MRHLLASMLLFIAASPGVATANSIDAIKVEPNPARAGQEVRITIEGDTSESVYCGLLTMFGDGRDQRIVVGGKEGSFPKTVTYTYASPGNFVVKAEGRKVDGRFGCVGSVESRLVIEPALVSTTPPLAAQRSREPVFAAPRFPPAAPVESQELKPIPIALGQPAPAIPAPSPANEPATAPAPSPEPVAQTLNASSPGATTALKDFGSFLLVCILFGAAGCVIVSIYKAMSDEWVFYYDRADVWKSLLPWHAIGQSIAYNHDTTVGVVVGIARMILSWAGVIFLAGALMVIFAGKSKTRQGVFKAAAQIAILGIITRRLINGPAVFGRLKRPPP